MVDPIRALCVGGDALAPAARSIEETDGRFDVRFATDRRDALARLDERDVDCVVGEVGTLGADGIEALRAAGDAGRTVPFVAVTEAASPEQIEVAVDAGASDFHRATDGVVDASSLAHRIELAVGRTGTARSNSDDVPLDLDRFRSFADAIADPLYVLDDEGYYLLVNEAHVEYTGVDRADLLGVHASTVIGSDAYDAAAETIASWYGDGRERGTLEVPVRRADGEQRTGETHVTLLTEDGALAGTVGVVRDVTERDERTRELGLYEAITETAPIGMFAVNPDGEIVWCNERMTDGFEWSVDELVGKYFAELVAAGYIEALTIDEYADRVRHLLSSSNDDEKVTFELVWNDDAGDRHVTEVHMGLLPLEDGEFAGTVYAFRRITERKRYETELERQNERLENFASFVSHDLRNPLNVADGYLELLKETYDDPSLAEVAWALDRMEELIDDLLTLAREGETVGEPVPFSPAEVVEDAWAAVDTADATLAVDVDADCQFVGDPSRVKTLVENLLRNSLEHGPEPDREDPLTVRVGCLSGEDDDETRHPWRTVTFFVEDDGQGLPDDADVFESGFTTNEEGTGLGLAIVSEIVDAHGWEIDACEGADGGARFEIRGVSVVDARPAP